jgi:hypothetical protein
LQLYIIEALDVDTKRFNITKNITVKNIEK